jgi:hypothetical protein
MLLTVVPLHYPNYGVKGGVGTFPSEPPTDLNVAAGLPVTDMKHLDEVLKRWSQSKAAEPVEPAATPKSEPLGPEVVRLDTPTGPGGKIPETGALPEPTVARAEPVNPVVKPVNPALSTIPRPFQPGTGDIAMNNRVPVAVATPLPTAGGPRTAVAVPRPTPLPPLAEATPAPNLPPPVALNTPPRPAATPAPAPAPPPATSPTGVPLKPFVQSNSGVAPPPEVGGTWRVYTPGTQPRGRTVVSSEAAALAGSSVAGDRLYLSGNFFVSAKGDNKAVLRPRGADAGSVPVRVIAEFPPGASVPAENEVVSRDSSRAFEIQDISKAEDGVTVNVRVREITRAQ